MEGQKIAEAFVHARKSGTILHDYPGTRPESLKEAYAIQDHALEVWNRPIGGWKVGKINPPLDDRLGANRLAGPIFEDVIVKAGASPGIMPIFHGGFAAVEAEFMLRISPPSGITEPPTTNAQARDWVSAIRIGLEIASSPYPHINSDGPCVTVSDHGNNMSILLGPAVPQNIWENLDEVDVALSIDGLEVGRSTTAQMLDGPFGAIRFLLTNLHERGRPFQSGWWISTGAITGVHEVSEGQKALATFGSIGSVEAIMG